MHDQNTTKIKNDKNGGKFHGVIITQKQVVDWGKRQFLKKKLQDTGERDKSISQVTQSIFVHLQLLSSILQLHH